MMKKIILWLVKVFKVEIPKEEKIVTKVIYKEIVLKDSYDGDLEIKGNFKVNGKLTVTGGITCYSTKIK